MSIIDTSYFQYPPLFIPNSKETAGGANNIADLVAVINEVEYLLLFNALGNEQYNELMDQFELDGNWKVDALQKWKDFVDGVGEWRGLRFTMGASKRSLIAYYVYYQYLLNNQTPYTTTGLQRLTPENASPVDPVSKLVREWNTFVTMYQGYYGQCYCSPLFNDNSLFHFMTNNSEVYDTQYFQFYQLQNVWAI